MPPTTTILSLMRSSGEKRLELDFSKRHLEATSARTVSMLFDVSSQSGEAIVDQIVKGSAEDCTSKCQHGSAGDRSATMTDFEIINYLGGRDQEVAALILFVQQNDVGLHVPIEEQPELLDIGGAYREGAFWLAVAGGDVVGTIGMMRYGTIAVMKKLFVRQDYQGREGVAHPLYTRALEWASDHSLNAIFLDTPSIATRSHAFYRRRGFRIVDRSELPQEYSFPDRDSLIFKLDLPCG